MATATRSSLPRDEAIEFFRQRGVRLMFNEIKQSLKDFGVEFDVYFHEDSLHESGKVERALEELKASGALYEAEGAWWLRSTDHGDEKDRVVIKSDGNAAYIAGDIAYIRDKAERGADLCIYLLGADHHGYIARLKAAAAALGYSPEIIEVIIGQMVNLVKDGQPVRMSKRAGTVVTMEDLVDAVGVDAARYSLARSSADSSIDIDLDLLASKTNANPVFYVQYAHARTCGVQRNAAEYGIGREDGFDASLLEHEWDAKLLGVLGEFPRVVTQAVEFREQHRVARYLEEPRVDVSRLVRPHSRDPAGRRGGHRPAPHSPVAERCRPAGAAQWPAPHRRVRARADVTGMGVWSRTVVRDEHGVLTVGGMDVRTLAAEHGTPLYVVDEDDFRARAAGFRDHFTAAFGRHRAKVDVFYAGKAFLASQVAGWMREEDLCLDVASRGELEIALRGGMPPERIGLHGNNKAEDELRRALSVGVGRIIVDSFTEIEVLDALAREMGVTAPVLVRVTTGVHAGGHEYIATSHEDQKFGLSLASGAAYDAMLACHDAVGLNLLGIHTHIGSQILSIDAFRESADRMLRLRAAFMADTGAEPSRGGPGRRLRDRLHRGRRGARTRRRGLRDRRCRGLGHGSHRRSVAPLLHRAGPCDRRPRRPHSVFGGRDQGCEGSTRVAPASTSRWTAA
ncbi:hypothetical protein GCM10025876_28240 [Demequina litorisediminis]|uniref:DALR anticodon binding domain-containing protein n=1 Tax=Demequina litorisediminis TaxID=1849022 RepID=A0ABQ6IFS2_9MICO|nr:hypothetical protein GCM10025876_28240 [Demequina litorisediminis]